MRETTRPERRSGEDRRKRNRSFLKDLILIGKRRSIRRAADRRKIVALDQYSPSLLFGILSVLSLSLLDALLTLILVSRGAHELNPIMAYYLSHGTLAFLLVKYGLTALAVILIVLLNEALAARYRLGNGIVLHLFAACFGSVVIWQFYLLSI
jgi:hypothetical protein